MSTLVDRIWEAPAEAVAVEHDGDQVTYGELRARVDEVAASLLGGGSSLGGAAVAFLAPPSIDYVALLLGAMRAGGTAVPLSPLHTAPELEHILAVARPAHVLGTEGLVERLPGARVYAGPGSRRIDGPSPTLPTRGRVEREPEVADVDPALMLFTSGTTGKPKGVVLSHGGVAATCASLHEAWGWRADDRLLHVLPLHHTHGVIVALLGALWAGARVRFTGFEAQRLWRELAEATVFMAVPTIYFKLMEAFRAADPITQVAWRAGAERLRLFTSGSAALPAALLQEFQAATGQTILERYGMTEIGMALSNPLAGPRVPGAVGLPLPGVTVDLVADDGRLCPAGEPGELRVRSPQLFSGYHDDPEGTARSYDAEGRFRTGDTGVRDEAGVIRLLGRTSTDVLKSGGYKLSALEIEDALRDHPAIAEVAVIGLPDEVWGDRVTACVVLRTGQTLTLEELRSWARDRLAPYKLPRELRLLPELPRNAMGKVQKGKLKQSPER
jgi:malonyl-CoA/methylmalonyl-CoA synthetase